MNDFNNVIDLVEIEIVDEVEPKMVQETLSRMGIANKKDKVLYPSCYLYEENGFYYIAHFKELFALRDGGFNNLSDSDLERRNAIIFCLERWGLIRVTYPEQISNHEMFVFILPYKERGSWTITHKYKGSRNV